ncbi:Vitamin B12 ABC transporter, substrate-binding protein BtuF [hydrothermal vent metagenome]|uniref:Vitamin B12 ABC transporter, substrate-binding protein BtuF n=1 Tax=hydrothermal vent metagenome TaxID=652676 RepID=A0A3B1CZ98_9ZZZZ
MKSIRQLTRIKTDLRRLAWRCAFGFVLGLAFIFPVHAAQDRAAESCVSNYDQNKDYFPDKLKVDYAEGFEVSYHKHYKRVKVAAPWKEGTERFEYLLVQCGTPTPKGFEHAQVITIPAKSMIVLSTTYFYFVEQLGLLDQLIGIANFKRVNSPAILKLIAEKKIVEVGRNIDLNLESTALLNPDIVMTYATGNPFRDSYGPLMEFGIRVGVFAEYMEPTPLGRAEWMKFMALFFNREKKATSVFNTIANHYETTKQLTKKVATRPTVFTGKSIDGTWYMAGGHSYMATFLKDAGAHFLWSDNTSRRSLYLDFESVFKRAADADYWLNTGLWKSLAEGRAEDARYAFFSAFRVGKIYNYNALLNPDGGNDYWERGIVNPHLVLADMIKIIHPELLPDHKLIWYRPLQ